MKILSRTIVLTILGLAIFQLFGIGEKVAHGISQSRKFDDGYTTIGETMIILTYIISLLIISISL